MLKNCIEEDDKRFSPQNLIEKYQDELKELCKYNSDTKDTFGFVNTWWVFGEVAKQFKYQIFMAEVENIGYKRTKRGEKTMPNDLFRADKHDLIIVDDRVKKTALDYLRRIQWD